MYIYICVCVLGRGEKQLFLNFKVHSSGIVPYVYLRIHAKICGDSLRFSLRYLDWRMAAYAGLIGEDLKIKI